MRADGLCGNVPVQYGPQYANPLQPGDKDDEDPVTPIISSVAPVPTQSYAPARSKGATDAYGGGLSVYNVKETPSPAKSSAPAAPAAPAVTQAPKAEDAVEDDGIVSTTTYTSEGVVYEVAIKEVAVTVTVDAKRRRHAHMHRRNREHGLLGRN